MLTLSKVKLELTTILKWAGVIFGILLALFLLVKIVFFVKNIIAPTPPAPPNAAFGKIPAPYFPSGIKRDFSYKLDTVSGQLPSFADRQKVYKMVITVPQLLNFKNASSKITSLGFGPTPEKLSDSVYRWKENGTFTKALVMDVDRLQFSLSSNFLEDPNIVTANNLPSQADAISQAKDFLSSLGAYPQDIDESKTQALLFKIDQGVISPAQNSATADLVSVYFYQKNVNGFPIVYPGGKISSMNVTIAGGPDNGQVVDARFFYQKVTGENAEYGIKTAKLAYDELKQGKAYIGSVDAGATDITIKKVYVAYYSPGRTQNFLLPIIVFEGSNNFVAYVSAVKDEWLSK